MTTGFSELIFPCFSKNHHAGFGQDDGGVPYFGGRSPTPGDGMGPKNFSGLKVHAINFCLHPLVPKTTHEIITLHETILEYHGTLAVTMHQLGFRIGNINHGIAHSVSRGNVDEVAKDLWVRSIDIVGSAPAILIEDLTLAAEVVSNQRTTMKDRCGVLSLVLVNHRSGITRPGGV